MCYSPYPFPVPRPVKWQLEASFFPAQAPIFPSTPALALLLRLHISISKATGTQRRRQAWQLILGLVLPYIACGLFMFLTSFPVLLILV